MELVELRCYETETELYVTIKPDKYSLYLPTTMYHPSMGDYTKTNTRGLVTGEFRHPGKNLFSIFIIFYFIIIQEYCDKK